MLFPHLLNRKSFVTELGELDKFFPTATSESALRLKASNRLFSSVILEVPPFAVPIRAQIRRAA